MQKTSPKKDTPNQKSNPDQPPVSNQREYLEIGKSIHYENMDFSQIYANSELPALEYDPTANEE